MIKKYLESVRHAINQSDSVRMGRSWVGLMGWMEWVGMSWNDMKWVGTSWNGVG